MHLIITIEKSGPQRLFDHLLLLLLLLLPPPPPPPLPPLLLLLRDIISKSHKTGLRKLICHCTLSSFIVNIKSQYSGNTVRFCHKHQFKKLFTMVLP